MTSKARSLKETKLPNLKIFDLNDSKLSATAENLLAAEIAARQRNQQFQKVWAPG